MYRKLVCSVLLIVLAMGLIWTDATSADDEAITGVVGWWKFDEGSGTTANDSSGSGNHSSLQAGTAWAAGQLGGAVKLDGSDDYVNLPIGSLLSTLTDSSFLIWTNYSQQGGAWQRIFDFGTGQTVNMFLTPANGGSNTGNMRFAITTAGAGSESQLNAPNRLATGWHHIAVVFNGTTRTMQLYLDGVVAVSGATNTLPENLGETTQNWLGRSEYSADAFYQGSLDDFRIYNKVLSEVTITDVMKGIGPVLGVAGGPKPDNKATDVLRDTALRWNSGPFAKTHNVYFGTVFDDVNSAGVTSPLLVSQGQEATTFDPAGLLDFGQTYYWRIDEVNAPDKPGIFKGNTWSFTAETYGYYVKPIKATASSFSNALTNAEKTIDGSGLDSLDQHGTSASTMWLSKKSQTPVWIQYDFDAVYSLHQMWAWNQNQLLELDNGNGAKDVTIEVSTDGTTWTALAGVPEFAQGTAEDTYVHNTTVEFGGVMAKFVRLNILSNWGDAKSSGLSEVRFFYVPTKAFGPTPATGATGVAVDGVLNWRAGRTAASHEVYFGTDPNALSKVGTTTEHRYSLISAGAEYDKTYYWKINEVNAADVWGGDVWNFTTAPYFIVDNFESYDDACARIFFTWVDGYGATPGADCVGASIPGNGTGAAVGNISEPYAEQTFIHSGSQSLPLFFDNPGATSVSEATRTFTVPQDWIQGGAKTLVLYFRGAADNAAGQIYLKINNSKVVYNGKSNVLTMPLWYQWNIDLASVGGNLRSVGSLTIGVSGTGKGVVYVDDIILYRTAPAVAQPVNPGTTNRVAYYAMEGDAKDTAGKGYNGILNGDPDFSGGAAGFGQAMIFDGINDYVDLPVAPLLGTLSGSTFTAWVNCNTSETPISGGGWERVFDFGTGETVFMYLCVRQGSGAGLGGFMRGGISSTGNAGLSAADASAPMPLGWHHVALVIEATSMTMRVYLDGSPGPSSPTTVLPKDLGVTTQNWLGRSEWSGDSYYKGMLDEFTIYNRALTEGEIRYLAGDR